MKILGGGKSEYYKLLLETTKKRGGPSFEIAVGGSIKVGDTIFASNLVGGNPGGNYE